MRWKWLILLALLLGTLGCGTQHPIESTTSKLSKKLGKEVVETLKDPTHVTYFLVRPDYESEQRYKIVSQEKKLPEDLQWVLQETLLDDRSYYFNKTKMCLFVPELGFRFQGKDEVILLMSFSCCQMKFISEDKGKILDDDPQCEAIEINFKELMTHF